MRKLILIPVALLLGACGADTARDAQHQAPTSTPRPTTIAEGNAAWFASLDPEYSRVQQDLGNIGSSNSADFANDRILCQKLHTDTATLQQKRPAPDPATNALYQDALTNLSQGSDACVLGVETLDVTLIQEWNRDLGKANTDLNQLIGMLHQ